MRCYWPRTVSLGFKIEGGTSHEGVLFRNRWETSVLKLISNEPQKGFWYLFDILIPGSATHSSKLRMYLLQKALHECSGTQSCLTLCYPVHYSPLGSSVHGILQARIVEFVAISYSRGSSWPRDEIHVSCISCVAGRFCATEPPGKTLKKPYDPPFSPHWSLSKSCSLLLLGSIPTDLLPSLAEGFS